MASRNCAQLLRFGIHYFCSFHASGADWLHLLPVPGLERKPVMRSLLTVFLCTASAGSLAQSIYAYKSVHTDGSVTYSDTRPASDAAVEQVQIYQGSAAIEQQGEERVKQMDAIGKELEKQRTADAEEQRKREKEIAKARQEVADAERFLTSVLQSKKNATPQRMRAAREQLRLARERLQQVQKGEL